MAASDHDGMYFARRAAWRFHEASTTDILDDDGKPVRTLDGRQPLVFHEADGSKPVMEFIAGGSRRSLSSRKRAFRSIRPRARRGRSRP